MTPTSICIQQALAAAGSPGTRQATVVPTVWGRSTLIGVVRCGRCRPVTPTG